MTQLKSNLPIWAVSVPAQVTGEDLLLHIHTGPDCDGSLIFQSIHACMIE